MKTSLYAGVIIYISLFSSCSNIHKTTIQKFGTLIHITVISNKKTATTVFKKINNKLHQIQNLMSPFHNKSDIFQINKNAGIQPVVVHPETYKLIKQSIKISQETNRAFDITFASIAHLWNYKKKNFTPPSKEKIITHLPLVDSKHISLGKKTVYLKNKQVKIGLGAIAKGYAIKECMNIIKQSGISSAIIEAGGDLQVLGKKYGKQWKSGLQHPTKRYDILLIIKLNSLDSIATSGDYERYTKYKGKRYSHIIDPRTGYPANNFTSLSVIAKNPVSADAYATALSILNKQERMTFIKKNSHLGIIQVDHGLHISITKNLKSKIKILTKSKITWF